MLIVLFVICILIVIIGAVFSEECDYGDEIVGTFLGSLGIVGVIVVIIAFGVIGFKLHSTKIIDQKIEYIQQYNVELEGKIQETIKEYCEYEGNTYIEVAPDNPTVLFVAYPELKADELFNSYINTLVENNKEVKELQLEKINASVYKWWLYFGK